MVREKIIAMSSDQLVILVAPEKLVKPIGERGPLPIEVLPFAAVLVERELARLGVASSIRPDASGEPARDRQQEPGRRCAPASLLGVVRVRGVGRPRRSSRVGSTCTRRRRMLAASALPNEPSKVSN
jgi:Ribose 5-phosphate isomerase A (phosphoriboisomerase A)